MIDSRSNLWRKQSEKISDGFIEVGLDQANDQVTVTLSPDQYDPDGLGLISAFMQSSTVLLAGSAQAQPSGELAVTYVIPSGFVTLSQFVKQAGLPERIALSLRLLHLADFQEQGVTPLIHPDNIFVNNNDFRVAHRGVPKVLAPEQLASPEFLKQLKAVIVTTVLPKYHFEPLIDGLSQIRDRFVRKIAEATDIDQLTALLNQAYQDNTKDIMPVGKQRYRTFKWLGIVMTGLAIVTVGSLIYLAGVTLPKQNRVIASQNAYAIHDYTDTVQALKNDDPKDLSNATRFVLETSYVNLDNLSQKQKQGILSNLSPKSSENNLLYWIYSGRGDFKAALNLAQSIGDNQLILYAYTKLFDATKANNKINGAEKQQLLKMYQDNITKYYKKVGGSANVNTAQ